ncbi:MAG TPA: M56 family metallopeptidase [Thermoanaerobaculia bacterium]|nr:M56 family metallopeptidase [Thermoanaerobaculia bacterium]
MNAMEMLTGPFAQAIGWALLHLVWQATIVAGILAAVLALLPRESANARYAAACSALAFVFAMFVTTAIRAYDPAAAPVQTSAFEGSTVNVPLTKIPAVIVATAAASWRDRAMDAVSTARQSLPTVVACWFLGVFFLSARLLVSWFRVRALTHGAVEAGSEWQSIAARLSDALGLRRAVRLLESAAVEVPSVLGTLRPVILLPASTLVGLTPAQLEMVLAHELAHIRRHDFLINLLQAFVETLMFYHPAVWWMSRRVRIERENCCDDLAVAVCGNALQYAKALTRLEELRAGALPVVVAANGGSLLDRIRRIAAERAESTGTGSRWAAAVAMLAILGIALIVPSVPALAQRDDAKASTSTIDVVEPEQPEEPAAPAEPGTPTEPTEPADASDEADFGDFDDFQMVPPEPPAFPPVMHPHPVFTPMTPMPPMPPMKLAFLNHMDDDDDRDRDRDRERSRDGKLDVDDLIALRATGVTPEYINEMRSLFPKADIGDITGMSAVGVTADYIRQLRAAGLEVKSASAVTGYKAVGVTPEYISQMREAGFAITDASDATGLKAVGVTVAWVREMRAAGLALKAADDAMALRAVGVTPEYVAQMRAAGFTIADADDATGLKAVGVTPEYIREMAAAGVKIVKAEDATSLKAVGVTPEFVKQLAAAGYTNLSIDELTSMAAHGINSDFVRDMQQYRDKN